MRVDGFLTCAGRRHVSQYSCLVDSTDRNIHVCATKHVQFLVICSISLLQSVDTEVEHSWVLGCICICMLRRDRL